MVSTVPALRLIASAGVDQVRPVSVEEEQDHP
jgi:hypothetical protein